MASKPPRPQQKTEQHGHVITTSQQWSGPLPSPQALEHFNAIIPNGADRIVAMVEREQAERLSQESIALRAAVSDKRRGQWLGAAIGFASIAGAVFTAYIGAPAAVSVALVGLPIAGIVQAIVGSRSSGEQK